METQKTWLQDEAEELNKTSTALGEKKEALKIDDKQMVEVEIDFSKQFEKWTDPQTQTVKKIIPLIHEGKDKVFWLNVKNPLYRELIDAGSKGLTKFRIMRLGTAKATKYTLVK